MTITWGRTIDAQLERNRAAYERAKAEFIAAVGHAPSSTFDLQAIFRRQAAILQGAQ